jgi:hypothetical protein
MVRGRRGRCQGQRVFVFPASGRDLASTYFAGASVPARPFANALRDLKALI